MTITILTFPPLVLYIVAITWPSLSWRFPHWFSTWRALRDHYYLDVSPLVLYLALITGPSLSWRFPHWFSTWQSLGDHRYFDVFPTGSLHGGHYVTIAILAFFQLVLYLAVITWPSLSWHFSHWFSPWRLLRDHHYLDVFPSGSLYGRHSVTIIILTFSPLVPYMAVILWPS